MSTATLPLPVRLAPASIAVVSTIVDAPIEEVWAIVSDPTRYPELSPENVRADVPDGLEVGATFTGHNRRDDNEWSQTCVVTTNEAPHTFAFRAGDEELGTDWRFELCELGEGRTQVVQSFDGRRLRHPEWAPDLAGRHSQLVGDMQTTLAALHGHFAGGLR